MRWFANAPQVRSKATNLGLQTTKRGTRACKMDRTTRSEECVDEARCGFLSKDTVNIGRYNLEVVGNVHSVPQSAPKVCYETPKLGLQTPKMASNTCKLHRTMRSELNLTMRQPF